MTKKDAGPALAAVPEVPGGVLVDQDAPLVARAKRGDREAFSRLVERHHRRVFGTAHHMLGDREAAADMTQDTFLAAWRSLGGFEERARFSTWITKIAMNRCRNALRAFAAARTGPLLTDPPADPARGPEAAVGDREVAAHLERALGQIDPGHREILILREIDGLSYDEMAEILDLEAGTVKSRLHRARAALREKLRGVWPP
jgi:RNA polymerase sigma-70 factor (ECF subfamily)